MTDQERVQTPRLELVPLSAELLAALVDGDRAGAARLVRFTIPDGWPSPKEDRFLRLRLRQLRADGTLGPWLLRAIILLDDGRMVGHVGFHGPPGVNGLRASDAVEIGYTIFTEHRGRGYATEAARALVAWAGERGVSRVIASVAPANAPSLRIVEKLGLRQIGSQVDDADGKELVFEVAAALSSYLPDRLPPS